MSRGDLTEAEWRILKDLLPIERKNRGRGCGFHKVRDREFSKFGTSISESRGQAFQKVADNLTADF
jgi:hypothetical protein